MTREPSEQPVQRFRTVYTIENSNIIGLEPTKFLMGVSGKMKRQLIFSTSEIFLLANSGYQC